MALKPDKSKTEINMSAQTDEAKASAKKIIETVKETLQTTTAATTAATALSTVRRSVVEQNRESNSTRTSKPSAQDMDEAAKQLEAAGLKVTEETILALIEANSAGAVEPDFSSMSPEELKKWSESNPKPAEGSAEYDSLLKARQEVGLSPKPAESSTQTNTTQTGTGASAVSNATTSTNTNHTQGTEPTAQTTTPAQTTPPPPPEPSPQSSAAFQEPAANLSAWAALSNATATPKTDQAAMEAAKLEAEGFDISSIQTTPPPPVTAAVYSNGISFNSPVILGSFEFKPPWTTTGGNSAGAAGQALEGQYLSPTGKLMDLQNILKQAITTSTIDFFKTVGGVNLSDDGSVTSAGTGNFSSELVSLNDTRISSDVTRKIHEFQLLISIFNTLERISLALNVKKNSSQLKSESTVFATPIGLGLGLNEFATTKGNGTNLDLSNPAAGEKSLKEFFIENLKYDETSWNAASSTTIFFQLLQDLQACFIWGSFDLYDNEAREQPTNGGSVAGMGLSTPPWMKNNYRKLAYAELDRLNKTSGATPSGQFRPEDVSSLFLDSALIDVKTKVAASLHFVTRDYIIHLARANDVTSKTAGLFYSLYNDAGTSPAASLAGVFSSIFGENGIPGPRDITSSPYEVNGSFSGVKTRLTGAGNGYSLIVGRDPTSLIRVLTADRTSTLPGSSTQYMSGKDFFVDSMLTAPDGERLNTERFINYATDLEAFIGDDTSGITGYALKLQGGKLASLGNPLSDGEFFYWIVHYLKLWLINNSGMMKSGADCAAMSTPGRYQLADLWVFMIAADNSEMFVKLLDMIIARNEYQVHYAAGTHDSGRDHGSVGYGDNKSIKQHYYVRQRVVIEYIEDTLTDNARYGGRAFLTNPNSQGSDTSVAWRWGNTHLTDGVGQEVVYCLDDTTQAFYLFPDKNGNHPHVANEVASQLGWSNRTGGVPSLASAIGSGTTYPDKIFDVPARAVRIFQIQAEYRSGVDLGSVGDPGLYDGSSDQPPSGGGNTQTRTTHGMYSTSSTQDANHVPGYYGRVAVAMHVILQLLKDTLFVAYNSDNSATSTNTVSSAPRFYYNRYNAMAVYEALNYYSTAGEGGDIEQKTKTAYSSIVTGKAIIDKIIDRNYLSGLSNTVLSQIEDDALEVLSFIGDVKLKLNNEDMAIYNILHYLQRIKEILVETRDTIKTNLPLDGTAEFSSLTATHSNLLSNLRTTTDGALACQNLTRDQLCLTGAIMDGLKNATSQASPGPVYLPASKALFNDQFLNLMTWMSQDGFSPEAQKIAGRPRILVVGLPSGMLEYLRDVSESQLGDSYYGDSTFIKIVVHRKNLVSDAENPSPLVYYFDTSKFIIEGIPGEDSAITAFADTNSSSGIPDRTVTSVANETVVKTFALRTVSVANGLFNNTVESPHTYKGGAAIWGIGRHTAEQRALRDHVFMNHVSDYYLKLYLRLACGIDVNEDVFVASTENALGIGTDSGVPASLFNDMMLNALTLDQYFPKTDAEAVQYQKLGYEISRSLLFSTGKYINRATQLKFFDRVLCLLFYEQDPAFMSENALGQPSLSHAAPKPITNTSNQSGDPTSSKFGNTGNDTNEDQQALENPSFYNFFVTAELSKKP